ncbi:prolyl aminopeptidase [Thermoactinospora rubra]|uniref:prolyl aminopeptidase n=1 Tax=Thermoactinospora rubra TaxID=1088767 RepID=UPI000A11AB27|nr:prolyl aminopeptidase [Thermoactinospora rubra]
MHSPTEPRDQGMLDVGDGNQIYWEVGGNPEGKPALAVHGGPGSGSSPGWRRLWNPEAYRIVLFDQRGCGRSTPNAADPATDLGVNTTRHLVADMERLREHLGVERWQLAGGSWGSTLMLAYAEQYPERVTEMIIMSVTAGRRREVEWITREMGRIFPEEWDRFRSAVPEEDRDGNLAEAYARLLRHPDPEVREHAAREWCRWEDTHVSLVPGFKPNPRYADPAFRMTFARLVTHYWANGCFLEEGVLLDNAGRLSGIPGVLIHGRYDVSSPLETAWLLQRAWPGSELIVVDDAGHGGATMWEQAVAAADRFSRPAATTSRRSSSG